MLHGFTCHKLIHWTLIESRSSAILVYSGGCITYKVVKIITDDMKISTFSFWDKHVCNIGWRDSIATIISLDFHK